MSTNTAGDDRARYERLRRELTLAIPKKRAIDKQLAAIETQIYNLEGVYITETAGHSGGNLIQGFDNYLKGPPTGRKRADIHDNDRLFSNSSLTHHKVFLGSC
jgi:chromatin modification-related protein EAF6